MTVAKALSMVTGDFVVARCDSMFKKWIVTREICRAGCVLGDARFKCKIEDGESPQEVYRCLVNMGFPPHYIIIAMDVEVIHGIGIVMDGVDIA